MNSANTETEPSPTLEYLQELHRQFAGLKAGQLATYIPELAKANPDWFGICLVTATGGIYEVGDTSQAFTIQSISKPIVYGMALEDNGRVSVLEKVGVEPTGDLFNSISLEPGTGRPRNPMINAGAIATAGLIGGKTARVKVQRLLEAFGLYAGRELSIDDAVYRSESETGHRNRAIGYMLRNFGILSSDPMPVVELYFQQCSISVTCRDLAVMAATLANRGVNPITGKQAIRGEYVESVLSVMESCGMYDFAGEWIYNVGMPAKSGVSGGIMAVLPGQLGLGIFSPLLDAHGNSVRGIRVCEELSRSLNLHQLNRTPAGASAIRLTFSGAEVNSSRVRTRDESRALFESGAGIQVFQLQGHLMFVTAEVVLRRILEKRELLEYLVIDLKRVLSINESACNLLYRLLSKFREDGTPVLFTHTEHLPLLRRYMKVKLGEKFDELFRTVNDNDAALEWCENRLLERVLPTSKNAEATPPEGYELFADLLPEEFAIIKPLLKRRVYQRGEVIIRAGDDANELFMLSLGNVSVMAPASSGSQKRLATFSPGMCFGEMAIIDRAPRSAMIIADTEVECDLITLEVFEELGRKHPAIKIKVLENLSLGLCRKLRKANRELSMLE